MSKQWQHIINSQENVHFGASAECGRATRDCGLDSNGGNRRGEGSS